jgi:hypothetical protein
MSHSARSVRSLAAAPIAFCEARALEEATRILSLLHFIVVTLSVFSTTSPNLKYKYHSFNMPGPRLAHKVRTIYSSGALQPRQTIFELTMYSFHSDRYHHRRRLVRIIESSP